MERVRMSIEHSNTGDARIARLETIVERLATDWERERAEIVGEIRSLRKDFASSRATPWAPIGIGASVVVAIVSLGSTLVWTLIRQNDTNLSRHVEYGHIDEIMKVAGLEAGTEAMDRRIDAVLSEIRLRAVPIEQRLATLDASAASVQTDLKEILRTRFSAADARPLQASVAELREIVGVLSERSSRP